MYRRVITCCLTLLLAVGPARAGEMAGADAPFALTFARLLEEAGMPGGAYAIVREGELVESGGHGVRRVGDDAPVTADTVFRIASVSKTFAAQLGAMLAAEGRLDWEQTLTSFLPGFRLKRPGQADRLQVQHLLGQSTGVVPNAYDNLIEDGLPLEKILPRFAQLEPVCATGRCYTYQNILFSLVAPAYERAGGASYEALLRERVLVPLGLHNTSVGMEAYLAAEDRAAPHRLAAGDWQPVEVRPDYYQLSPAAGVNASANDLGRWLLAQMGSHPDVVAPAHVELLTQRRVVTLRERRRAGWRELLTAAHYGLGWRIYSVGDETIVMHSGRVKGFVAEISYSPERRTGLAVVLNGESRLTAELGAQFWAATLGLEPPATGLLTAEAAGRAAAMTAAAASGSD